MILSAPLTKAHATGVAVANPRPIITAAKATELRALLADAKAKADAEQHRGRHRRAASSSRRRPRASRRWSAPARR